MAAAMCAGPVSTATMLWATSMTASNRRSGKSSAATSTPSTPAAVRISRSQPASNGEPQTTVNYRQPLSTLPRLCDTARGLVEQSETFDGFAEVLAGLRERVWTHGGELTIQSAQNGGTSLHAHFGLVSRLEAA